MAFLSNWFVNDQVFLNASNNNPPLKKGDAGESVRYLQQALIVLGQTLPISTQLGSPDGEYGSETKSKVIKFQQQNGLANEADGRVGKNTLGKIDKLLAERGKFRPTLPPLPGSPTPQQPASTLDQISQDVVAILKEAATTSISMTYEFVYFSGSSLWKVAEAIEEGKIKVAHDSSITGWAEYIPFNDVIQKNQLNLSFSNPRSRPFFRSVVVHEAVHAHHDMKGFSQHKYHSEGLAYAVQAWYHMAVTKSSATPVEIVADTLVANVFQAAVKEVNSARTEAMPFVTGVHITSALEKVPAYEQMRTYIPYDGVN